MSVFGWLNDQLLRMTWLNDLVGAGVAAIGLDPASRDRRVSAVLRL